MLVTAGIVCALAGWNLPLLLGTLSLSAIIGDSVGYYIGRRTGPKIFTREKSRLFARNHLERAQKFYEKHGGKTIILARFVPFIRTFAPVVAGVGRMDYRKFLLFNITGGIGWVFSMILTGYLLPSVLNPPLQRIFGEKFLIQEHVEKVILVVIFISILPIIFGWLKSRFKPIPTVPHDAVTLATTVDS